MMMRNALRRRVLAAKTLPNHRFGRERVLQRPPLVENPDEDQQLESELQRLQKNMQQMEGELEQLRKAEIEAQKPRFNIRKATNLNLVPKGPNPPNAPARAVERPSELFLLDDYKHRSCEYSNLMIIHPLFSSSLVGMDRMG
jgi:hypothetical protein